MRPYHADIVRRRTNVVGCFPDGNSALMLAAARLRHIAGTRWSTYRSAICVLRIALLSPISTQDASRTTNKAMCARFLTLPMQLAESGLTDIVCFHCHEKCGRPVSRNEHLWNHGVKQQHHRSSSRIAVCE